MKITAIVTMTMPMMVIGDTDDDDSDDDGNGDDDSDDDGGDYTCGRRPRGPNIPGKNLDLVRGSRGPSTVTYHENT